MNEKELLNQARLRLIDVGGRVSQDFGLGRIFGQVLVYLYLQEEECSLDLIGSELNLSKASVSIAVRQLEQFALARKVWKAGDRKSYYKSADNIGSALQDGALTLLRQKVKFFGDELTVVKDTIEKNVSAGSEIRFLESRVNRAIKLQKKVHKIVDNPIINHFLKDEND